MTVESLTLYAQLAREFQLAAVQQALRRRHQYAVESEPPEGISRPRWRAMLAHAARTGNVDGRSVSVGDPYAAAAELASDGDGQVRATWTPKAWTTAMFVATGLLMAAMGATSCMVRPATGDAHEASLSPHPIVVSTRER